MFPASQLEILAYNRTVSDLNGLSPEAFIEKLAEVGTVKPTAEPVPQQSGVVCTYVAGKWYEVQFDGSQLDPADVIDSLDVARLQNAILSPILGINDIRPDKRIDFVGGIRGTDELQQRVDSGTAAAAFSMYPTSIEQLFQVSDVGQVMPPKSTWFEPKLRSGLFVHQFEKY